MYSILRKIEKSFKQSIRPKHQFAFSTPFISHSFVICIFSNGVFLWLYPFHPLGSVSCHIRTILMHFSKEMKVKQTFKYAYILGTFSVSD